MSTPIDYKKMMPKPSTIMAEELEVEVKPIVKEWDLKVVALRKGFYKRCRYEPGQSFTLDKKEHFGSWMKKI